MNFDFSPEQELLRDQARSFLAANCGAPLARKLLDGNVAAGDDLYRQMAELGWIGTGVPEEYGGFGAGGLELCVLAEELGRGLAPAPIATATYLAIPLLLLAGSEAQKRKYLTPLVGGELTVTIAVNEGPRNATPRNVATMAENNLITGVKYPVADGARADLALVLCADQGGGSFYLVALNEPGVVREDIPAQDPSRPQAKVSFDGAQGKAVGKPGEGWALLAKIYDHAAVLYAFEQMGGAHAALDQACDYARARFAFGRAIGSYQGVKHKLADMYVAATLAKSNCYYAAWALSTDAAELPLAAGTARGSATKAFDMCASENIQIHGGMGCTWEVDCHLYYRRARSLAVNIGSNLVWEEKLVRALETRPEEAA
mgnify:FL=1